jgi:hypothetical protein
MENLNRSGGERFQEQEILARTRKVVGRGVTKERKQTGRTLRWKFSKTTGKGSSSKQTKKGKRSDEVGHKPEANNHLGWYEDQERSCKSNARVRRMEMTNKNGTKWNQMREGRSSNSKRQVW